MPHLTISFLLLLLSCICFFVAAFNLSAKYNVNTVALGLFLGALSLLVA